MDSYIINFNTFLDRRGALTAIEGCSDIPFEIKRIFYMHHITDKRGGHAHIDTDQVLIPIQGRLRVKLFNGKVEKEYVMDDCTKGLYIPRLYFTDMYDFSPGTVCLVLSNTHYDMRRSLRSIDAYMLFLKDNGLL